jgi:catechol 2,3-dioxygenase-like lactoylglutathione lyase family enzyme
MSKATLEHVNVTVTDPKKTADLMGELFDWHIRWQGSAANDGFTIHVGTDDTYIAVYSMGAPIECDITGYAQKGGLNHIGIVVDDLDATEERVRNAGYTPHSHADYEPGRRFYFHDNDAIEFEVISYA